MKEIKYPTRCKIIDVTGMKHPTLDADMLTPDESKPHIGKTGLAEYISDNDMPFGGRVKITLDNGNIIYGDECWWVPIKENER